jgi:hypothetical protein
MSEFSEPFSFLFFIVLSLFFSPKDQDRILIDCISAQTGQIQLMSARKTERGYRVNAAVGNKREIDISVQPKKKSELIFYAIDQLRQNESIDLTEIVKKIKPFETEPVQTVAFPNDTIQFVLSDKNLYIYFQHDQKLLVIH